MKTKTKKQEVEASIEELNEYPEESRYKGSILIPKSLIDTLLSEAPQDNTIYSSIRVGSKGAKVKDFLGIDYSKKEGCCIVTHRNQIIQDTKARSIISKSGVKCKVNVSKNTKLKHYCSGCGLELDNSVKFCSGCGSNQ